MSCLLEDLTREYLIMRIFCFVVALASAVFATSAASQAVQSDSNSERATGILNEELSRDQRSEILRFMESVWAVGEAGRSFDDDIDYIDSINLWFDGYESSGVPWWQVFGTLLFVSEVGSDLLDEEYGEALKKVGDYVVMDFLNSNLITGQLLGFQSYSSLATLAVSLPLEAFVELVDKTGFHNQMTAYKSARLDIGLTHEQISKAQSKLGVEGKHGTVYFSDDGWIIAIDYDDDVGGEWAGKIRRMPPISTAPISMLSEENASELAYDLIRIFLNAPNYGTLASEDVKDYVLAMQAEIDRRRALEAMPAKTSETESAALGGGDTGGGLGGGGGGSIESGGEDFANGQFVSAVKQALAAAALDERERRHVYEGVAAIFEQIVSDFPNTPQAVAILSESVPGIDFNLLKSARAIDPPLQSGLYAIDPALCEVSDSVGDGWSTLYQSINGNIVRRGAERQCSIIRIESDAEIYSYSAECSVEGSIEAETWKWTKTSETEFVEVEGRHAGKQYGMCPPKPAPDVAVSSGEVASQRTGDWGAEIVLPPNHPAWSRRLDIREDQFSILTGLGVPSRAIEFAREYDYVELGGAFAREFVELGVVDLVHMQIGHIAGTSDRFRPSAIVNGEPDVIAVTGPGRNLTAQFTDAASRKLLRQHPQAIGGYAGVTHRALPVGGQRFVVLAGLADGCRDCSYFGTSVQFIDFDQTGRLSSRRNIGLVDSSVSANFDGQNVGVNGKTGWELTNFAANYKALQYRLNMLGYDAGEIDGIPGPQTRQALMEFQAEHCQAVSGQPNTETVTKLQKADGLTAPCASTPLPGVSANSPLLPGIYVANFEYCDLQNLHQEPVYSGHRIVKGSAFLYYFEDSFGITRSDIVEGKTQLRGIFHVGNTSEPGKMLIDVLAPDAYLEVADMPGMHAQGFKRCPDDSPLVMANAGTFTTTVSELAATSQSVAPPMNGENFQPGGSVQQRSGTLDELIGSVGRFSAPDGYAWLQLASRSTLDAARGIAQLHDGARVFRADNEWFAIAVGPTETFTLSETELSNAIEDWKSRNGYPRDAFLTEGATYIEEYPIEPEGSVSPAFSYTSLIEDSTLYSRRFQGGQAVYDNVQILQGGTEVVLWGTPDWDRGDCLIDGHEPIFVKCHSLAAFADQSKVRLLQNVATPPPMTGELFEPERGSDLRKAILNAARPKAEELYGREVQFVIESFRVIDKLAYFSANVQRPGGIAIDVTNTPAFQKGWLDPNLGNLTNFEAILSYDSGVWKVSSSVGQVTEAWWLNGCLRWGQLFPETCGSPIATDVQGANSSGGDWLTSILQPQDDKTFPPSECENLDTLICTRLDRPMTVSEFMVKYPFPKTQYFWNYRNWLSDYQRFLNLNGWGDEISPDVVLPSGTVVAYGGYNTKNMNRYCENPDELVGCMKIEEEKTIGEIYNHLAKFGPLFSEENGGVRKLITLNAWEGADADSIVPAGTSVVFSCIGCLR